MPAGTLAHVLVVVDVVLEHAAIFTRAARTQRDAERLFQTLHDGVRREWIASTAPGFGDAAILTARTSERLLFGEPSFELDGAGSVVHHAAHAEEIAFGEFQERAAVGIALDRARSEPIFAAHAARVGAGCEVRRPRRFVENGGTMTRRFPERSISSQALLGCVVAGDDERR